ncbi:hypothetical protein HGB47_20625 [Leptospira yasudae]|uniref:hypothetical protein n=1 Tax=Leptospira yasudae TaxID=2202201 RepID=UPI001C4EED9B|nr:hypothetical protein [Leptospira yasudae]MBW0436015.1 hypothetical protein [Leptospira yasudae]
MGEKPLVKHIKEVSISLSVIFFLFIYYGLYHGYKWLEDSIEIKFKLIDLDMGGMNISNIEVPDFDIGPLGIILNFIGWLLFSFFIIYACLYFVSFVWITLVFVLSILNWIFYKGLRVIFLNSKKCHGNHLKSFLISGKFTLAYVGWAILLISAYDYLKQ